MCLYLAVTDFRVSVRIGSQDSAQGRDSCVALECWVLGERAMQISLNLITCQRAAAHTLLQQPAVVPGVRGHVMYSTCKHTIIKRGSETQILASRMTHTHLKRASTVLLAVSLELLAQ